jgi:hypothetical protein
MQTQRNMHPQQFFLTIESHLWRRCCDEMALRVTCNDEILAKLRYQHMETQFMKSPEYRRLTVSCNFHNKES